MTATNLAITTVSFLGTALGKEERTRLRFTDTRDQFRGIFRPAMDMQPTTALFWRAGARRRGR